MASSRSSDRSRSHAAPRRLGCETPRIFTAALRKLTPRTKATERRTLGYSVIDFATEMLGIELLPWQCWALIHVLELLPDNSLRYRTVVLLVARQNGKSLLSQVLGLWFMYVYGCRLVLGTAQDLDTAEEVWAGAVEMVTEKDDQDEYLHPELAELVERVWRVNGKKALLLRSGERWKVKAATRGAGRGLSGDVIFLDELREHQSWDAWGAITKTTMARAMALILCMSNAGDAASIVLRYLRKLAVTAVVENGGPTELLSEVEDLERLTSEAIADYAAEGVEELEEYLEDEDTLGIFEWSAPPGCDIWDRDGWAQANPSLGYTITERAIAAAARTDPEWIFRTEVLCQWSSGTIDGPFPPGAWAKSCDPQSSIADGSLVTWGIDVSWDRTMAYIAAAGVRDDGLLHVEVVAQRAGTDWLVEWLTARPDRASRPVAVQAKGAPASGLAAALEDAGIAVVGANGPDLAAACGALYDRIRAAVGDGNGTAQLRHLVQPVLDTAAATAATRPLGDAWVWDRRKSPSDISPLVAVTLAAWACEASTPATEPDFLVV